MGQIKENIRIKDLKRLKNIATPTKRTKGASVELTGIFKLLHQNYKIGTIKSKKLSLIPSDIRQIHKIILDRIDFDIYKTPIPENREETALYIPYEKESKNAVKGKMLKLYGLHVTQINGRSFDCIDGMNLEIDFNVLETIEHNQVVIVENYEAFQRFRKIQTNLDNNPLIVYRGDGENVISQEIIKKFPIIELIACFDLDPSGITLARATQAHKMLLPTAISDEFITRFGRKDLFDNQYPLWVNASNMLPEHLQKAITKHEKGITQEALLAHQIPLVLHKINQ